MLAVVLGGLYLGWYRWPGWYLTNALRVVPILASVDVALGPLLTLLIANPAKPRRELARDIGVIAAVQLVALVYGVATLWHGRPLYYTFSEDRLQLVQASDLDPHEQALALEKNPQFAPHWYSLPRWVWAPLPQQESARQEIVESAVGGGDDVIQMPRYLPELGAWPAAAAGAAAHGRAAARLRLPREKAAPQANDGAAGLLARRSGDHAHVGPVPTAAGGVRPSEHADQGATCARTSKSRGRRRPR